MYSEENERLAEAAYNRFRAAHDASLPEWAAYAPKHTWRDLVNTFQSVPRSHASIANPMEQCVSDAITDKTGCSECGKPCTWSGTQPDGKVTYWCKECWDKVQAKIAAAYAGQSLEALPEPEAMPEPKPKPAKAKDKK